MVTYMRLQAGDGAARLKDVHGALARLCSHVSGETLTEDTVRQFKFRDWRKYAQVCRKHVWILMILLPCSLRYKATSSLQSSPIM